MCYLFLIFLIGCLVLLFLVCVGITGVVEYLIGYAGIRWFHMRLWDYRGLFLNLNGIICFRSVVSFGVLGLVFHYLIEPLGEKLFRKLPLRGVVLGCSGLVLLFLIDCILSACFRTPILY